MEEYGESKERHSSEGPYGHNPPQYDTTPRVRHHEESTRTNINSGGTNYEEGTRTTIHDATGEGHDIGGTKYEDNYEDQGKHGGSLHRSGSGSSSSSEDDGEGGRRKKKSLVGKIKEKLPGGGHHGSDEQYQTSGTATYGGDEQYPTSGTTTTNYGGGHEQYQTSGTTNVSGGGYGDGEEVPEKKGLMQKIKEKLPGNH